MLVLRSGGSGSARRRGSKVDVRPRPRLKRFIGSGPYARSKGLEEAEVGLVEGAADADGGRSEMVEADGDVLRG